MTRNRWFSLALALGIAALFLVMSNPAVRADNGAMPKDKATLDAAIHDYLLRHPEVLDEMVKSLRDKEAAQLAEQSKQGIAANKAALLNDPADPVLGNPAAKVTLVEFFDYECPFCKGLWPELSKLIATNQDVRIVMKDYPILGPGSQIAARAALAAQRQGKYGAFHGAMMSDHTAEHHLDEAKIMSIAQSIGLDIDRLKTDMASPEIAAKIAANHALADKAGIRGTPTLILDDTLLSNDQPYTSENLSKLVADRKH